MGNLIHHDPSSPPPSRADTLRLAGEGEQRRDSAHQDSESIALTCVTGAQSRVSGGGPTPPNGPGPADPPTGPGDEIARPKPKPHYYHLGVGFGVRQYGIGARKMALKLPDFAHGSVMQDTPLQGALATSLNEAAQGATPGPLTIQSPPSCSGAPLPFTAQLTGGGNALKVETTVNGYQLDGKTEANLNQLLGKTLAIHIQRSGILRPTGDGNFRGKMLGKPEASLQTTEMMGVKLFVFLRARVDGAVVIREALDGKLSNVVTPVNYERRKFAEPKVYSDSLCGSMPLIPGVYQVCVLLQDNDVDAEGAGQVSLAEVHCDGDCLYP